MPVSAQESEINNMLITLGITTLPEPSKKRSKLSRFSQLSRIPLLAKLLENVDTAGTSFINIEEHLIHAQQAAKVLEGVGSGLHYFGFALSALDFLRIPLVYLGAWILGEPLPFTLSKTARWLYSGVLLGLGIAALVVPGAAMFIAIAAASLTLATAIAGIGNTIFMRIKIARELKNIEQQINPFEQRLNEIQNESIELKKQWAEAFEEQRQALKKKIEALYQENEDIRKNPHLLALINKKSALQQQKEGLGFSKSMRMGAGAGLAAIALIGLVISLYFPVPGLIIVGSAAVLGIVVMIGIPLTAKIGSWLYKKLKPNPTIHPKEPAPDDSLVFDDEHQKTPAASLPHDSEREILGALAAHQVSEEHIPSSLPVTEHETPFTVAPKPQPVVSLEDDEGEGESRKPKIHG